MLVSAVTLAACGAAPGSRATGPQHLVAATYFISACGFSHRAWDDPIVSPRRPGLSHNHTFVGNVSTNAYSTLASLRRHGTTCVPQADTAAYWAPTLLLNDRPILPGGATVYYRRLTRSRVTPFPAGLRMVAGNSRAHRPQSLAVTYWDCSVLRTTVFGRNDALPSPSAATGSSRVPDCPATTALQLHVNFPDCWNGRSLDSGDHRSHMAYSRNGVCPAGPPRRRPGALRSSFATRPAAPAAVILSSGGQYSGHADFINAWNQRALTKLVVGCLDDRDYRPSGLAQEYNQCSDGRPKGGQSGVSARRPRAGSRRA